MSDPIGLVTEYPAVAAALRARYGMDVSARRDRLFRSNCDLDALAFRAPLEALLAAGILVDRHPTEPLAPSVGLSRRFTPAGAEYGVRAIVVRTTDGQCIARLELPDEDWGAERWLQRKAAGAAFRRMWKRISRRR
jgi:hypothetical protein